MQQILEMESKPKIDATTTGAFASLVSLAHLAIPLLMTTF